MSDDNKTEGVQLVALDSFHSSQTGTVPARAPFETHRAHADELIKRGLAAEATDAPARSEKKAPEAENKKAPTPSNKAKGGAA